MTHDGPWVHRWHASTGLSGTRDLAAPHAGAHHGASTSSQVAREYGLEWDARQRAAGIARTMASAGYKTAQVMNDL